MSKNFLSRNEELRDGDYLLSNNGQYKAIFQDDGNFVIYTWKPVWASNTDGSDAYRLCMQGDCNLVLYNGYGQPRWATNTDCFNCKVCHLQLTDDGALVVQKGAETVWSSETSKGRK
ncbi:mannose-specific lectin CEA-like isoform X2 [Mugil cephalus]|uniref:mannose-specific lectin CEA-like isoform X2 n=1 Tax=Mugil cephalus TaxID=48193 RepID=UPI001FB60ECE|nr:mannose-specific lectin CEA-like isoform X2 [Mugil cephalus]